MRVWVALVVVCALGRAHADVGVVAGGDPTLQKALAARVAKWLTQHDHDVDSASLGRDARDTLANCFVIDDVECARRVVDARMKSLGLVFAGVDVTGKDMTFTIYWFVQGHSPHGEKKTCNACDTDAWHALVDNALARLEETAKADMAELARATNKRSYVGPALLAGAGLVAAAVGVAMIVVGSQDDASHKWIYPGYVPAGIAVAAVGGGAMLGGGIWLVKGDF